MCCCLNVYICTDVSIPFTQAAIAEQHATEAEDRLKVEVAAAREASEEANDAAASATAIQDKAHASREAANVADASATASAAASAFAKAVSLFLIVVCTKMCCFQWVSPVHSFFSAPLCHHFFLEECSKKNDA